MSTENVVIAPVQSAPTNADRAAATESPTATDRAAEVRTTKANIKQRKAGLVERIVALCREQETSRTAAYVEIGSYCYEFVTLHTQDGGKKSEGVTLVQGELLKAGLATRDVSTYVKSYIFSVVAQTLKTGATEDETVADVMDNIPLSALIALLPLVSAKSEEPALTKNVDGRKVVKLVSQIIENRLPASKVRDRVRKILGKDMPEPKAAHVALTAYLNKDDNRNLAVVTAALYHNAELRKLYAEALRLIAEQGAEAIHAAETAAVVADMDDDSEAA